MQAWSGHPCTPGSKKARYRTSCLRPSNRSSRLILPLGPSNSYFFSTSIHGIRRRSAASASRERVKTFSFTSICSRAASHSSRDTIEGIFIATCSCGCSLPLCLLLAISLRVDIGNAPFIRICSDFAGIVLFSGNLHGQRRQSSGGDCAGHEKSQG